MRNFYCNFYSRFLRIMKTLNMISVHTRNKDLNCHGLWAANNFFG